MANKKIAITFAGLGLALVALAGKLDGDNKTAVEEINAALTELGNQPAKADPNLKKLEELKAKLEAKIAQLSADNAGKDVLIKTMQDGQKEAAVMFKDLKAQLQEAIDAKAVKSNVLTVKIDGVTYQVNHGSYPHSAKELAESPELVAEILKIEGQNTISKL